MAERGWTRRWALALLALSAALVTGGEGRAATPEKMPGRQFNSKLRFRVYAQVEEDGPIKVVGHTPSEEPLAIPACRMWWVEALGGADMAAVASELDAQKIPGLALFRDASDGDLAHLEELKGLRELNPRSTKVTGAGIAELGKSLPDLTIER